MTTKTIASSVDGGIEEKDAPTPFLIDPDSFFPGIAEPMITGASDSFVLAPGQVWLVRKGHVDLFAVPIVAGATGGPRIHMVRAEAGRVLFGIDHSRRDHALLAVGTNGTSLLRVDERRVHALSETINAAGEASSGEYAVRLVESWVDLLSSGLAREMFPQNGTELDASDAHALGANDSARPRDGVLWIRHREGHSHLFGREELTVNGAEFVPLSRNAWIRAAVSSQVHICHASAFADTGEIWRGLTHFHELVLEAARLVTVEKAVTDRERLRRRLEVGRGALQHACARLLASLDPGSATAEAAPANTTDTSDRLLTACRVVGDALKIKMQPPTASANGTAKGDRLRSIARASRARTRRVLLRDDWWKHDNGPLLAYIADGNRPVALIPHRRAGYRMHDPGDGSVTEVDAELAQLLVPTAHAFYRAFPDHPLTTLDVFRFAVFDCERDALIVLGMAGVVSVLALVPPIAMRTLFDSVIPGSQRGQLLQITAILIACALASTLLQLARGIAFLRIEGRASSAVQCAVWDRLLSLPTPFFRPYAAGNLATRAMGIDGIRQIISGTAMAAVFSGVFSFSNIALMYHYSSDLAWRGTMLILVAIAVTTIGSFVQLRSNRTAQDAAARTSGLVLQLLGSVGKLRVAGAESYAFAAWARLFGVQREAQFRQRMVANLVGAFNTAFPIAAALVIFYTASATVGSKGLTTGAFLAFLTAFTTSSSALLGTCSALLGILGVVPLYELAKPILEARPEVDVGKTDPGALRGDIEVQQANFRYTPDGPLVLRDVSLHVHAGQFVAFVGPSGSGKSTLLRLLLGFETLESGAIYYDGQEIGGLDVQALRRQIGVVLQNGRLRSGDIFTNIVGSAPLTIDDAWEAARLAGFADDIKAMPMGMHTMVSEGGTTLSGGQRQRLMIARALVQKPRLFFFDEATSALDNRTQAIVSASLDALRATRIVVAHRLSTIMNADHIVVIERGRIVQTGPYDELMRRPGAFRELAKRQLV